MTVTAPLKSDGFDGSGISTLVADAGLTNGAFYGHFDSKDDLIAAVVTEQLANQVARVNALPGGLASLKAFLAEYLSPAHRDDPGNGCPSAALLDEIARSSPATRAAYTADARAMIDAIARHLDTGDRADAEVRATGVFTPGRVTATGSRRRGSSAVRPHPRRRLRQCHGTRRHRPARRYFERTGSPMKAYVVTHYGPDGLALADVPDPTVGPRDALVEIRAASINPLDKMLRNGEFKQLLKYKGKFALGHDLTGVITRVGADVHEFKVGDEVYARPRDLRIGAFAERIASDVADVALKPTSLSFAEAGAVPLVALAARQALVDVAQVQPGQQVLVHAGAGGLGSTVIQVAKHLGAYVATTANTKDVDKVHSLGADEVVDYTTTDFAEVIAGYDVVLDSLGAASLANGDDQPQGARPGEEARRALLLLLHAGQWSPAQDPGRPVRRRNPAPGR